MTLEQIITMIANVLANHGAHHAGVGAVSHALGWVETKHWIIRICRVGTRGCSL